MTQVERKAKPILFTGPNVVKIMQGLKTQTRRLINPQPIIKPEYLGPQMNSFGVFSWTAYPDKGDYSFATQDRIPKYQVGDLLWVRELLRRPDGDPWVYAADNQPVMVAKEDETAMLTWAHHKEQDYCPSMFMPRWASRVTLEVTQVRAERVGDISEEDARAEGAEFATVEHPDLVEILTEADPAHEPERSYVAGFQRLWNSINAKPGRNWAANPWVFAYNYQLVEVAR